MFTIIRCEHQRKGLARFLVRRKFYFDVVCEKELRFMQLLINDREKIDWERIRQILGDNRGDVIAEEGIIIPPDSGILPFDMARYRRRLALSAAVALLRQMGASGKELKVSLAAEGAEALEEVRELLPCCSRLNLLTSSREPYATAFGGNAKLVFAEQLDGDENLLLVPVLTRAFAETVTERLRPLAIVGGTEGDASLPGTVLTGFYTVLPQKYMEYMPPKINPEVFAAAFSGCCRKAGPEGVIPDRCDMLADGRVAAHQIDFRRQIL